MVHSLDAMRSNVRRLHKAGCRASVKEQMGSLRVIEGRNENQKLEDQLKANEAFGCL